MSRRPLRRVLITLHGPNGYAQELIWDDATDSQINRLKTHAQSGKVRLGSIEFEEAAKTRNSVWQKGDA